MAIHCGYDENQIDNMSYIFYRDIISELAIKFQYESVLPLLSRDYSDEKVSELVTSYNPLTINLSDKAVNKNLGKKVTLNGLRDAGFLK